MTLPTIGQMVHYVSYGSADGRYESKCRPAFVTEVHPDYVDGPMIGLMTVNPSGIFFDQVVRHSESEHTGGTWHWACVSPTTAEGN